MITVLFTVFCQLLASIGSGPPGFDIGSGPPGFATTTTTNDIGSGPPGKGQTSPSDIGSGPPGR